MSERPQLLLLPGLLNDAELWRDQLAALADHADCLVPDLTHGTTLAELARAVLATATTSRFSLAGFSLGGYVAQEVMRLAPERVDRLALLDTAITPDSPARAATRQALDAAARTPGRFHGFGEKLLRTYLHPDNLHDPAIAARIRGMTERLGPAVFLRQNAVERTDGTAVLRALRRPLLVLCGEADAITPPEGHRAMAALVPGSALVIVSRAGHMAPIENPAAVTAALRTWLAAPPRG